MNCKFLCEKKLHSLKKLQKKETIILNYGKLNMYYVKILKKYQFSIKKI